MDESFESGASKMHRLSAVQLPWRPFTVVCRGDVVTASPKAQLEALVDEMAPFWKPSQVEPDFETGMREHLGSIDVLALRRASSTFSRKTASSLDAFHPRLFSMLCDEALRCLALILLLVEMLGTDLL